MDGRQIFDVDPSEKDEFKAAAAGRARWDTTSRRWYMTNSDVAHAPNKEVLASWRPPYVSWPVGDADVDLTVCAAPHECLRCHESSLAVVGFTIDDGRPDNDGVVYDAAAGSALRLVADALSGLPEAGVLRHTELAHFRRRWSNTRREIYFANCCRKLECEFIFGEFYLHQTLVRADADGTLIKIARVRVPRYRLDDVIEDFEDE